MDGLDDDLKGKILYFALNKEKSRSRICVPAKFFLYLQRRSRTVTGHIIR